VDHPTTHHCEVLNTIRGTYLIRLSFVALRKQVTLSAQKLEKGFFALSRVASAGATLKAINT
jgi:hypothetical protein